MGFNDLVQNAFAPEFNRYEAIQAQRQARPIEMNMLQMQQRQQQQAAYDQEQYKQALMERYRLQQAQQQQATAPVEDSSPSAWERRNSLPPGEQSSAPISEPSSINKLAERQPLPPARNVYEMKADEYLQQQEQAKAQQISQYYTPAVQYMWQNKDNNTREAVVKGLKASGNPDLIAQANLWENITFQTDGAAQFSGVMTEETAKLMQPALEKGAKNDIQLAQAKSLSSMVGKQVEFKFSEKEGLTAFGSPKGSYKQRTYDSGTGENYKRITEESHDGGETWSEVDRGAKPTAASLGGSKGEFSKDSIENLGASMFVFGKLPSGFGQMRDSNMKSQVANESARLAKQYGISPVQWAQGTMDVQSRQRALNRVRTVNAQVLENERVANDLLDRAKVQHSELKGYSGIKGIDNLIFKGKNEFLGKSKERTIAGTIYEALVDYSRVISGNISAQGVTDTARSEGIKLLSAADDPEAFASIIDNMKATMKMRVSANEGVQDMLVNKYGEAPGQGAAPAPTGTPAGRPGRPPEGAKFVGYDKAKGGIKAGPSAMIYQGSDGKYYTSDGQVRN
jgi:hypothetical protein